MIRNYLMIALRNFQRQRFFALLNMFGLALGLASAILIFLYVNDELQYDVMHPYYNQTYRIGTRWTSPSGEVFDNTTAPGYWTRQLKETRSEVVAATRIDYIGYPTTLFNRNKDKIILTESIKWAEPNFTDVLSFKLIHGNPEKMFENHNTMVISETGAKRLFDDADPIGETITVRHNWATRGRDIDVTITGVYEDYPSNSHFKPQYILNLNALRAVHENFEAYFEGSRLRESEFFENYIVLKRDADTAPIQNELKKLAAALIESDSAVRAGGWKIEPFIKELSELHFDEKNLWENDNTRGDKKYLAIFSSVAVLILVIACINYMNLATARAGRRAREVGLRKSLGSRKREIAKQFFCESLLMTVGSLVLAIGIVMLFLAPFNQLADKSFSFFALLDPYMVVTILAVVLLMAFLSGSYPAFYLSAFQPIEVLKGQVVRGRGAEIFRKTLVTIQYTISLVLIISTLIVIRQMEHMQSSKLNERGSQLLSIRYGGNAPQDKFITFKNAVLEDSDIEHVTMANHLPRLNYFGWIGAAVKFPEFSDNELQWNQLNVDFDFPKTYQLEFIAGRDFDVNNVTDSSAMILNEAAVRALNKPIEQILGASVVDVNRENREFRVIGIVKDFPFRSMHQAVEPLILNPTIHFIDRIVYIKLPVGKFQEKIASIEATWKKIFPGIGFDYWFVSDEFNRMYQAENQVSSLAKSFTLLAIIITAIGVFGLASYTAEQKTREIGIRKVLGASVQKIVGMMAWIFLKIFFLSSMLAVPAAYFLGDYWLKTFVYQSPVSPLIFLSSAAGLLLITLVTVAYETWTAARVNPVNSLRRE